jgi:hypothetical protein
MTAMIALAVAKYGQITPCTGKATLSDCLTHEPGIGDILWFNTPDGSTHVVVGEKS